MSHLLWYKNIDEIIVIIIKLSIVIPIGIGFLFGLNP